MKHKIFRTLLIYLALSICNLFASDNGIDFLRNKAQNGDIQAQLQLGKEFFDGINRSKNLALSFYYFNMAAKAGSLEGHYNLGSCYEFAYGVEHSDNLAFIHYKKASEKIDAAKFKVANYLKSGIKGERVNKIYYKAIPKDLKLAEQLLDELVKKDYPPALSLKAQEILSSKNIDNELEKFAFELLQKANAKGDLLAKKFLIDCFLRGIGCDIDEDMALNLTKELIAYGDNTLYAKLAFFYEYGIGVAPDMQKAVEFYQKASEYGDSYARVKVADQYMSGFYLEHDTKKALEIYYDELKKKNTVAYLRLADCFENGYGVEKNEKQAFLFYLKAATLGEVEAQYNLARLFREGIGTAVDKSAVTFWLKEGVKKRNLNCMRELAVCYLSGYGIERSPENARTLLIEAAKNGDLKSQEILDRTFE